MCSEGWELVHIPQGNAKQNGTQQRGKGQINFQTYLGGGDMLVPKGLGSELLEVGTWLLGLSSFSAGIQGIPREIQGGGSYAARFVKIRHSLQFLHTISILYC